MPLGPVDRLRVRYGRIAGIAVLLTLLALFVHNIPTALRNQRDLPRDGVDEMDDWFAVSSRDLEHVASSNPRHTVYGRIAVFYFLEQRISGATLTVPTWWEWNRWELEHVAHLRVEISSEPPAIAEPAASELRDSGERRRFQPRNHTSPELTNLYLLRDPDADRYVLVPSAGRRGARDFFVLSEEHYARIRAEQEGP